jgi:hypothetical protein
MARSTSFADHDQYESTLDLDAAEPLRFDATSDAGAEEYRAPRAGWLRELRGAVAVGIVAALLIGATWTAWAPALTSASEALAVLAGREHDGQTRQSATVALGGVAILAFVAAWWRASHPRRPVRLSDGRGRMAVDAIAGRLREAILELPHVRQAEVAVENRGGGRVRVRAWLRVAPDARIDDALDGVDDAADWLVHHRLGLLLAEPPLVDVRYDELDLRAGRRDG